MAEPSAKRGRAASMLNQGLPRTLAKLVDKLEKSTIALAGKHRAIETNTLPHHKTYSEAKMLLDVIVNICSRIKERVSNNPVKAVRLYSTSPLHAQLVKSVRTLLPTGWLYATSPDLAREQVDVIEEIVLRFQVSRWDWSQGASKQTFVPLLLSAMVLHKGNPLPEPEQATRLIDILLKGGATADPFGKDALVARSNQCQWPHSAKLVAEMGNSSLENYVPKPRAPDACDDETMSGESREEKPELTAPVSESSNNDSNDSLADTQHATKAVSPDVMENLRRRREESEQKLKAAEENLKRIQEERRVADAAAEARLREIEALDSTDLEDVSDEDEDYQEPDMEKLIEEEMMRLRAEAANDAKVKLEDEDAVLKKMYDLFSAADNAVVDVSDAGLNKQEFATTISVSKLEEVLAPIGGLDLTRVDPNLTISKGIRIPISRVFDTLDRDGDSRITATEFIKLLREKAPVTYSTVVEDSVLGKLYKIFSAADSGVVDVADAGLTEWEFLAGISLGKLQETLGPIGGIDLTRIDPKLSNSMDMTSLFKALDRNADDRITATEFVQLLKTTALETSSGMLSQT